MLLPSSKEFINSSKVAVNDFRLSKHVPFTGDKAITFARTKHRMNSTIMKIQRARPKHKLKNDKSEEITIAGENMTTTAR